MNWKLISGMAILLMVLTPLGSSLADAAEILPPNAVPGRHGTGWECMTGFQRIANRCVRIEVPANAYLDSSGDRWRCDRGYVRTNDGALGRLVTWSRLGMRSWFPTLAAGVPSHQHTGERVPVALRTQLGM